MSQATQMPHDSFSLFLKNVRKKRVRKDEPVATSDHLDIAILESLLQKGPLTVQDLVQAHGVSITQMFKQLGQLRAAEMVTVEPTTDVVELTEYGRQAAKLQGLPGTSD